MKPIHSTLVRLGLCSLVVIFASGCGALGFHSPDLDVVGSYFPAWMVCMVAGSMLTVVARLVLMAFNLDMRLRPAGLIYTCLMIVFTLALWLAFYRN